MAVLTAPPQPVGQRRLITFQVPAELVSRIDALVLRCNDLAPLRIGRVTRTAILLRALDAGLRKLEAAIVMEKEF